MGLELFEALLSDNSTNYTFLNISLKDLIKYGSIKKISRATENDVSNYL